MNNRRKPFLFVFLLIYGLLPLFNFINGPRFASIHGSDVVQLIASGMCFGAAISILVLFFRDRRSS